MKLQKTFSRILDGLILLVFILFFSSAGFQDRNTSGWYQQWFPNLNGSSITSITFLDSLTGFAVTNSNSTDQGYILKTTNGGDNWNIIYTYIPPSSTSGFTKIQFATDSIGYASTNYFDFFRTTNGGMNWITLSTIWGADDMAVINKDSIIVVTSDGFAGGVYRSTNGGYNWQLIWTNGTSGNPSKIYMYDKNMGFTLASSLRKTTNGGLNWVDLSSGGIATDIKFIDTLVGWKTYDGIKKTTDGGLNWFSQQLPNYSSSFTNGCISIINYDTVWMVGAQKYKRAPVYKTTDGGLNWGYQIPDTTLQIYAYNLSIFSNRIFGWLSPFSTHFQVHTTSGGNDTSFFTGISNAVSIYPLDYKLYQNYPNPFNSSTVIRYQVTGNSNVLIKVYDINGKEISTLINERKSAGENSVSFNGNNLSSGIYFYTLYVNEMFVETKRMTLLK